MCACISWNLVDSQRTVSHPLTSRLNQDMRIARVYVEGIEFCPMVRSWWGHFSLASVKSIQNRSRMHGRMRSSRITHEGVRYLIVWKLATVKMSTYTRLTYTSIHLLLFSLYLTSRVKLCTVWAVVGIYSLDSDQPNWKYRNWRPIGNISNSWLFDDRYNYGTLLLIYFSSNTACWRQSLLFSTWR